MYIINEVYEMGKYGLIGRDIDYSFSRGFFEQKFREENLPHTYENFDLPNLHSIADLKNLKGLSGLNVTIPYKEAIIPYLDGLDHEAEMIGAVNTIKPLADGRWIGYNTDHYGFARSLLEQGMDHKNALILGSGGASKAICYVLDSTNVPYQVVSRSQEKGELTYQDLNANLLSKATLIVNATPLGTHPEVGTYPPIPYELLGPQHLLFDLIYNPEVTRFMKNGIDRGCRVVNGQKMLEYQALKAWAYWNS